MIKESKPCFFSFGFPPLLELADAQQRTQVKKSSSTGALKSTSKGLPPSVSAVGHRWFTGGPRVWNDLEGFTELVLVIDEKYPLGADLHGSQVVRLEKESAAYRCGLRVGDFLIAIDGMPVNTDPQKASIDPRPGLPINTELSRLLEKRPVSIRIVRRSCSSAFSTAKKADKRSAVLGRKDKKKEEISQQQITPIPITFKESDDWPIGLDFSFPPDEKEPPVVADAWGDAFDRGARKGDRLLRINGNDIPGRGWRGVVEEFRQVFPIRVELERRENPWPLEDSRAEKLLGAWTLPGPWPKPDGGAFIITRLASGHLMFQETQAIQGWKQASLLAIKSNQNHPNLLALENVDQRIVPAKARQGKLQYVSVADAYITDLGTGESIKLELKEEHTLHMTVCGIEEPVPPWIPPLSPREMNRQFQGGNVDLIIVRAQDLLAMDMAFGVQGKSDPYIKVLGEGDRLIFKTEPKKKTLDPVWGVPCMFNVSHTEESIVFALFDSDFGSGDDPMGRATLHLSELQNLNNELWLDVEPEVLCPNARGRVNIQVSFRSRPVRPPLRGGIVELTVVEANGLLAVDRSLTGAKSADPYVKVRTNDIREVMRTEVIQKTLDPVWDASCCFRVSPGEQRIMLDVFDSDLGSGDDSMGIATLWLEDLQQPTNGRVHGRQRQGMKGELKLDVEPTEDCPKAQGRLRVQGTFYEAPLRRPFRGGTVKLKIVRAENLLAVDTSLTGKGASDPYVKVALHDTNTNEQRRVAFTTEVQEKTLNPVFNEECEFRVSPNEGKVALSVWDSDVGSGDDRMGRVMLWLTDYDERLEEVWLGLETYDKCPKAKGRVCVQIQVFETPLRAPLRGGHVNLKIKEAEDLLAVDFSLGGKGKSDPYVRVFAGAQREIFRSETKEKTLDPVWDAEINFRVAPGEDTLLFKVTDSDVGSGDDPMGNAKVWLEDLANGHEDEIWLNLEADEECPKAQGALHLFIRFSEAPERNPFRGGSVKLVIAEAADLMAMDFALRGKGTSDPYVVVFAEGEEKETGRQTEREMFRTKEKSSTVDPVFDESCHFSVGSSEEVLKFTIFDKDFGSGDDPMGDARIWLTDMHEGVNDLWLMLEPSKKCPKTKGSIRVEVIFHENPPRGKVLTLADRVRHEPIVPPPKKPLRVRAGWLEEAKADLAQGVGLPDCVPPAGFRPPRSVPPSAPPPLRPIQCGFSFRIPRESRYE